jgi:hypothetical protein
VDSEQTKARAGTAYHEAGHAVAAVLLGFQFQHATIVPKDDSLGHVLYGIYTMFLNVGHRAYARDLRDYLITNRASPIAEERHIGRRNDDGAADDDADFWGMLYQMYGDRRDRHARDLSRHARQLVAAHWWMIERVAQALIQEQTLSFAAVVELMQQ